LIVVDRSSSQALIPVLLANGKQKARPDLIVGTGLLSFLLARGATHIGNATQTEIARVSLSTSTEYQSGIRCPAL